MNPNYPSVCPLAGYYPSPWRPPWQHHLAAGPPTSLAVPPCPPPLPSTLLPQDCTALQLEAARGLAAQDRTGMNHIQIQNVPDTSYVTDL